MPKPLSYFVDYDEQTDLGPEYRKIACVSKREAMAVARRCSKTHGQAFVVATEGNGQACGHIPYIDGKQDIGGIDGCVDP
jgi:hypothetical protein